MLYTSVEIRTSASAYGIAFSLLLGFNVLMKLTEIKSCLQVIFNPALRPQGHRFEKLSINIF